MRLDLHSLIERLRNPQVRLEDNTPYCLSLEQLGLVYAGFVSNVSAGHSPGIMLKRNEHFKDSIIDSYQKNFQLHSREFFYALLGKLETRKNLDNAEELVAQYSPQRQREVFSNKSVEGIVMDLTSKGKFELIGEKLKIGAEEYHKDVLRKGQPSNYRLAVEYDEILKALRS